jgi:hypothetical protein
MWLCFNSIRFYSMKLYFLHKEFLVCMREFSVIDRLNFQFVVVSSFSFYTYFEIVQMLIFKEMVAEQISVIYF